MSGPLGGGDFFDSHCRVMGIPKGWNFIILSELKLTWNSTQYKILTSITLADKCAARVRTGVRAAIWQSQQSIVFRYYDRFIAQSISARQQSTPADCWIDCRWLIIAGRQWHNAAYALNRTCDALYQMTRQQCERQSAGALYLPLTFQQ